jgi:hypothetical protein
MGWAALTDNPGSQLRDAPQATLAIAVSSLFRNNNLPSGFAGHLPQLSFLENHTGSFP